MPSNWNKIRVSVRTMNRNVQLWGNSDHVRIPSFLNHRHLNDRVLGRAAQDTVAKVRRQGFHLHRLNDNAPLYLLCSAAKRLAFVRRLIDTSFLSNYHFQLTSGSSIRIREPIRSGKCWSWCFGGSRWGFSNALHAKNVGRSGFEKLHGCLAVNTVSWDCGPVSILKMTGLWRKTVREMKDLFANGGFLDRVRQLIQFYHTLIRVLVFCGFGIKLSEQRKH